jgi:hypothetical protein
VLTTLDLAAMAEFDRPVGIGSLITVDTTATVALSALANCVRETLEDSVS